MIYVITVGLRTQVMAFMGKEDHGTIPELATEEGMGRIAPTE
jgi:hypothetical protein